MGSSGFQPLGDILKNICLEDKNKYIAYEFQDYGYRLAEELEDLDHKALYIRLAKKYPRAILESARGFVKDAQNVRNRGRLFMWKLNELKKKRKDGQS